MLWGHAPQGRPPIFVACRLLLEWEAEDSWEEARGMGGKGGSCCLQGSMCLYRAKALPQVGGCK